jgi:hypothetical protein
MSGLTRRQILQRAGVTAAGVWAAPAVFTVTAKAVAGSRASTCSANCGPANPLNGSPDCAGGDCLCATNVDGTCQCVRRDFNYNSIFDSSEPICQSDADCPSDRYCVQLDSNGPVGPAVGNVACARIC